MTRADFSKWLEGCGVSLGVDVLERLAADEGPLRPIDGAYGRAHLIVAVRYDEAVRRPRHAWSSPADLEVDLAPVERAMGWVEGVAAGDLGAKEELTRELERELARRDPFGPLAGVMELLRDDAVEGLRGDGRLYMELRRVALGLAAELEAEAEPAEAAGPEPGPVTGPVSDPMSFGDDDDVLEALSEIAGDDEEDDALLLEDAFEEEFGDSEVSEAAEELDVSEAVEADEAVSVPPPMPRQALDTPSSATADNPFMRGEVRVTAKTESLKSKLEALKKPAAVDTSALMSEAPMSEVDASEGEEDWVDQETVALDPHELEGGGLAEMTQEATESHMDERLSLERRIERLNARRQEFLTQKNWEGLVTLYEDGLELFEGEERAQVLLTVAKLYAGKLKDVPRAVEFLGRAWEMRAEAPSARSALGLAEQVASRGGAEALQWLESVREDGDAETHEAWVRALSASGERERALLTWGAYLAEDDSRTSRRTLKTLETLSVGAQDEIVEGLYEDLLEQSDEGSRGVVSVSAAKVARGRGDDVAWTAHLEDALASGEDVWGDYAEVVRRLGLWGAWSSAREAWGEAFAGRSEWPIAQEEVDAHAGEASDEAIALWEGRVERSPADWRAVSQLSTLYDHAGRWPERYALLNRSAGQISTDTERVEVYLSMARIAVEHLEAPDEAAIHYARVIEIVPDHPEAHEGLQSLGA
jgi:tetratricopeptide (TPR) repeat protein